MATLVFQHHDIGTPGRLGAALRDHGHRLLIVRPDLGEPVPRDLDGVEAVVSLGGPQNVDDAAEKYPWIQAEIDLLAQAHERMTPVVGVCLGTQLITAALGGEVAAMDAPEVGFCDVTLGPFGQTDVILSGQAWKSLQFCHHSQQIVKAPAGAVTLASSERCSVQAFRAGLRTYAFQYHFEIEGDGVRKLVASAPDDLHRAGVLESDIDKQMESRYGAFDRLARRLCVNIAMLLAPIERRVVA